MSDLTTILSSCSLYGILDLGYVAAENAEEKTLAMLRGGIRILQLRAKNAELSLIESLAKTLAPLCRKFGCLFIINDYPEIAAMSNADGVHVGQDTPSLDDVRKIVGEGKIVGRSTHSLEQALQGWKEGADYIGFGPLFPTATKPGRQAIGLDDIARVHKLLPDNFPIFCIGGINESTLPEVLAAGAERVVIVSWLLNRSDAEKAAGSLIARLNKVQGA